VLCWNAVRGIQSPCCGNAVCGAKCPLRPHQLKHFLTKVPPRRRAWHTSDYKSHSSKKRCNMFLDSQQNTKKYICIYLGTTATSACELLNSILTVLGSPVLVSRTGTRYQVPQAESTWEDSCINLFRVWLIQVYPVDIVHEQIYTCFCAWFLYATSIPVQTRHEGVVDSTSKDARMIWIGVRLIKVHLDDAAHKQIYASFCVWLLYANYVPTGVA